MSRQEPQSTIARLDAASYRWIKEHTERGHAVSRQLGSNVCSCGERWDYYHERAVPARSAAQQSER